MWPYSPHIFTPAGANPVVPIKIGHRVKQGLSAEALRQQEKTNLGIVQQLDTAKNAGLLIRPNTESTYGASYVPRRLENQEENRRLVETRKAALLRRRPASAPRITGSNSAKQGSVLPTFKTTYSQSFVNHGDARFSRPATAFGRRRMIRTGSTAVVSGDCERNSKSKENHRPQSSDEAPKQQRYLSTTYGLDFGSSGQNPRDRLKLDAGTTQRDEVRPGTLRRTGEFFDTHKTWSTTRDLADGTVRNTVHVPNYMGHIPRNSATAAKMNDSIGTADKARRHTREIGRAHV